MKVIPVNQRQFEVMTLIDAHQGISFRELMELAAIKKDSTLSAIYGRLYNLGLARRDGKKGSYKFYSTGRAYGIEEVKPEVDLYLQNAAGVQLSDKQMECLKNNIHLPRTQLARKIGITKLELNFVLDKSIKNRKGQ